MKKEAKVAWPKQDPFTAEVQQLLREGKDIPLERIYQAVGDSDHQKVFGDAASYTPLNKPGYVIVQYSVYLRRPDGSVAVFHRAAEEAGEPRITANESMLLSASSPSPPEHAVPRIVQHSICVSEQRPIGKVIPRGIAWNPLPEKAGKPRPTYLTALYELEFPDDLVLHGRFRDAPDRFTKWQIIENATPFARTGEIDRQLARMLADGHLESCDHGPGRFIYSADSQITAELDPARSKDPPLNYAEGRNVFISHSAEDAFIAFALYRLLIDEADRTIFPSVDVEQLTDGKKLSKIETMIDDCDGLVLIITPNLIQKSAAREKNKEEDWVKKEYDMAIEKGKPVLGFKLGTQNSPDFFDPDIIANAPANYTVWLNEIRTLIKNIQERFNS